MGVDVFCLVPGLVYDAAAKGYGFAGRIAYGEHEAGAKGIVGLARLAGQGHKPAFYSQGNIAALCLQKGSQIVPFVPGPAQAEALHKLVADAALLHVGPARSAGCACQVAGKMVLCQAVHVHELFALAALLFCLLHFLPVGLAEAFLQGDACLGCQLFQRFLEAHAVVFHPEGEDVACFLAAKAVKASVWRDIEGRLCLLVEGAGRHKTVPYLPQGDKAVNKLHNGDAFLDKRYFVIVGHELFLQKEASAGGISKAPRWSCRHRPCRQAQAQTAARGGRSSAIHGWPGAGRLCRGHE